MLNTMPSWTHQNTFLVFFPSVITSLPPEEHSWLVSNKSNVIKMMCKLSFKGTSVIMTYSYMGGGEMIDDL